MKYMSIRDGCEFISVCGNFYIKYSFAFPTCTGSKRGNGYA